MELFFWAAVFFVFLAVMNVVYMLMMFHILRVAYEGAHHMDLVLPTKKIVT